MNPAEIMAEGFMTYTKQNSREPHVQNAAGAKARDSGVKPSPGLSAYLSLDGCRAGMRQRERWTELCPSEVGVLLPDSARLS